MAAVAGLVAPGLGGKGRIAPVLQGDPANGFPVHDVMVGRLQRRPVTDGELLLSPSELGVVLLDRHPLRFERRDDVIDHRGGHVHARRGETATVVDGGELLAVLDRERPFGLERCDERKVVVVGGAGDHALEERPAIGGVGLAVEGLHVDQHGGSVGGVGCDGECARVGHEPDLADGPHALDAREMIQHGEGLHRDRQADSAFESIAEVSDAGALATDDAVVVAVEEAHEAEARCLRLRYDLATFCVDVDVVGRLSECGRHRLISLPCPRSPSRVEPCSRQAGRRRPPRRARQCPRRRRSKSTGRCR